MKCCLENFLHLTLVLRCFETEFCNTLSLHKQSDLMPLNGGERYGKLTLQAQTGVQTPFCCRSELERFVNKFFSKGMLETMESPVAETSVLFQATSCHISVSQTSLV